MTKNRFLIISSVLILPLNLYILGIASANLGARGGFFVGCIFYWMYISLVILLLSKDDFYCFKIIASPNDKFHYAPLFKIAAFLPAAGAF
jgi:hypothetical protein